MTMPVVAPIARPVLSTGEASDIDCSERTDCEFFGVALQGVGVEYKSTDLTAVARDVLDRVVPQLQKRPEVRVEVAAHTDSIGHRAYNRKTIRVTCEEPLS